MALETKVSAAVASAMCDAAVDAVDGGSGAGYIEWRTGAPPANCAAADSGTLLGTSVMSDPAFGAAANGVATASAVADDSSADASGAVGHFRVKTSAGTVVMQGTAGEAGDTPNAVFDDKDIVAGGVIAVSSFTVTVPLTGA